MLRTEAGVNGFEYGVGWSDRKDGMVSGLSSEETEIKYTLPGDANLDGAVNGSDFSALAANFGQGDSGADVGVSVADIAALDAFAGANGLALPVAGAVPEPGAGGMVIGAISAGFCVGGVG